LKITLITIFPELFESFCKASLIGKAISAGALEVTFVNPRDFAAPPHYRVDDTPYGGGAGMVMMVEPLVSAIRSARSQMSQPKVIYLTPSGTTLNQSLVKEFANYQELILLCGRYEGIDQRVIDLEVDFEISLGDYILMGGEIPAMALMEAVSRLIPGILGNPASVVSESFSDNFDLEPPQFTKPRDFEGLSVPEILLSGDHLKISRWKHQQSVEKTATRRPDLTKKLSN
jgi:tRNA (guanine37-N1)-methyltransferase